MTKVCNTELYRPVRTVHTGTHTARYRVVHSKKPRIERYDIISSGNGRNFNRYRPAQVGNGRFRSLPHCSSATVLQRTI